MSTLKDNLKKYRSTLSEMWTRFTEVDKAQDNIYLNGYNNLYPNEVDAAIDNSPTARRCASVMSKFIAGKGLLNEDGTLVDLQAIGAVNKKGHTAFDIVRGASKSVTRQRGVFLWVGYGFKDGTIAPNAWEVLDFKMCRIAKEDTEENAGKIQYKDWRDTKKAKKDKSTAFDWFYPFNDKPEVVTSQILADARKAGKTDISLEEAIKHFRGQVYFLNLDPELVYPISPIDGGTFNEADTEYRVTLHTNSEVRSGFMGKTAVLTQGLDEEAAEDVVRDIKGWLGAENSSNLYHLDVAQADDLDKVLKIMQVQPQYDEKIFIETTKRIRVNIFGAFNNIPEPLVISSGSALFGTNPETYEQMKMFYTEQTEEERQAIERMMSEVGLNFTIIPLSDKPKTTPNE